MAIPILSEIEKLINEHGSAVILKERLQLAADQYAALEKKLADMEVRATKVEADSQRFELEALRLKEQIRDLEGQIVARKSDRIGEVREAILILLSNRTELDTDGIAYELGIRHQFALHHLTEMSESHLVAVSYVVNGPTKWSLDQKGPAYMVQHGLLD